MGARPCCFATKIAKNVNKSSIFSFRHLLIEPETHWFIFMAFSNTKKVLFFSRRAVTTNSRVCICRVSRLQKESDYWDLLQPLKQKHKEEVNAVRKHSGLPQQEIVSSLLFSNEVCIVYGRIGFVLRCLQPFAVVSSQKFQLHVRNGTMSLNTLKTCLISSLISSKNVSFIVPNTSVLVFDNQITPDAHYEGVFALFSSSNSAEFSTACLDLSSTIDETTQSGDELISILQFFLEVFGKTFDNITALIGDSHSTYQLIATKLSEPLLGCENHLFQFSVWEVIYKKQEIVSRVHTLIVKLRTRLLYAKLRQNTDLRAKLVNDTSWTSVCAMLNQHAALRELIMLMSIDGLVEMLLPPAMERHLD